MYATNSLSTREVFKDPITDPGKKSKKGRLTLEKIAYPADQAAMDAALASERRTLSMHATNKILDKLAILVQRAR